MLMLKLKCSGSIFEIGKSLPYRLISVEGLDGGEFDVTLASNGQYDGGYLLKSRIEPRQIDISFDMSNDEGLRRSMIKIFSPHKAVELTVCRFDTVRTIRGRITSCSIKQDTLYNCQTVSLSLICPKPCFSDSRPSGASFSEITPLLALPFALPVGGIGIGTQQTRQKIYVLNIGDTDCGFDLTVDFDRAVSAIKIENTLTGQFMQFSGSFADGDRLSVCTIPGVKFAMLNGQSCLNLLDRQSVFFPLVQGENPISITSSDLTASLKACISFEPQYLGV